MKARLRRNSLFILALTVIVAFSMILLCLSVSIDSASADNFTKEDEITIAHLTDTHYYAFRLGYVEGNPIDTNDDDYFYNYIMQKSTKMWLEGELIFDAGIRTLANAYLTDSEHAPDYLILSGDIAQDGELIGHIDVANKLRKLQNFVRANGKPGFQVFVVMGNHDLYNPESWRFDNATGTKTLYYYTSRIDAVRIYAGLGYPNMTEDEAEVFYGGLTEQDLPAGYEYVRSDLSDTFEYAWEFVKKDENGKTPIFRFGEGEGEYAADELTFEKLRAEDKVTLVNNGHLLNKSNQSYGYKNLLTAEELKDGMDIEVGKMTGIARRLDKEFTVLELDIIQSNALEGHILGGQMQFSTWDWLEENRAFIKGKDTATIVATCHHSVIPHWEMEEEITTGFIMYNWVEVADFLSDLGVRYVYTGHQHANDAVAYVNPDGGQLIDMESAANISVGSQMKWTTIERGISGAYYAERSILDAYENERISANELIEEDFVSGIGDVKLYDKVYKNDKYGYVVRNQMNTSGTGPYIDYTDKAIVNYSDYAQHRVYENIVDNYLAMFLRPEITAKLGGMADSMKFSFGGFNIDLSKYGVDIVKVADNLIKGINEKVLADYTYQGETARMKSDDMKVFAFLEELVYRLIKTPVADDTTILDTFLYGYMAHCRGTNVDTYDQLPANHRAVLEKVKSGDFITWLLDTLLDKDKGLMKLIDGLSNTTFNLSDGCSVGFVQLLNPLLQTLVNDSTKEDGYDYLAHFNLGEYLKAASNYEFIVDLLKKLPIELNIADLGIPEIIYDIVDKYATDIFKQGLGEYVYNIIVGFGVDGNRTDVTTNNHNVVLKAYADEDLTYVAKVRETVATVENGRLPSMITNVFGSDPATTRNFTYFTDRRITKGAIQYTTDSSKSVGIMTKAARTERYATTKALIDLGVWCQAGYYETSRHTVELTGLTADTTYYFRLGEPDKGYWSEWYSFRTGSEEGFEVLIASDLQASTESSYQRIDKIYRDVLKKQFENGIDFIINPGDVVDNSRNATQFKWFLNSSADIYAGNAMVVVAGNHDNKFFDVSKAKNLEYYAKNVQKDKKGNITGVKNVNTSNYNYLWFHYDYDLSDGGSQTTGFYYSFDYAGVHFTMLNTNDIEDDKLSQTQLDWLVNDLEKSEADYKVVVMHKSLYSQGSHSYDKDVVGMREQLTPIFSEYGVNLVLAGHDHTYNETYYLDKDGNKITTDANGKNEIGKEGTLYVTMGTMGEKFYNYKENDAIPTQSGTYLHEKEGKLSDPTFGKLVYNDGKLYYYGYQYIRTMSADGYSDVLSGEIVPVEKGSDFGNYNNIVGLTVLVLCVATIIIAVVAIAVTAAKKKKNGAATK